MQKRRFWQSAVAFFSVAAMVVGQGTLVLAGTTGTVNGDVTDPTTKAPIAGAKVTAASPSQVVTTTTDASGHYAFLSLAPDTYVISVEKAGFQPASLPGITVVSDQTQVENIETQKQLRTLATVTTRSSGTLVKSGTTTDVYNITPTQQAAAAPLGGGTNLNSAYSAIASQPGVTVPVSANPTGQQSIFIRGGDYEQTGNEVDGIPINRSFDQYASSPLSNLGNAEVQVYTGAQPADAQASGLAGFINQVIKTGTYPGFSNAQFGVGSPSFYHKFSVETGGATSNRNFSYYLGFLGYDQQPREIDQFNGTGFAAQYGSPINFVAQNCNTIHGSVGCYANPGVGFGIPLGPNGVATANTIFGGQSSFADREGIVNLHVGIPHPHDGQKDDVQFLYNVGQTYDTPNDNLGSFDGSLGDVLNGTVGNGAIANVATTGQMCGAGVYSTFGAASACAGAVLPMYTPEQHYTGPLNARLTAASQFAVVTAPFAGQNTNLAFNNGVVPFNQRDGETTGFSIEKIQYQRNFSSNAYARAYVYSNYSDRIDNGIVGLYQNYLGAFPADYTISSHTRGAALLLADQIDPHNLLSFDGAYTYNSNTRFNNSNPGSLAFGGPQPVIAYLVNSNNPTGGCFNGAGTAVSCTAATSAGYKLAGVAVGNSLVQKTAASPVLGTEGNVTCGTGPCEYLAINDGGAGLYNTVRPAFTNASISDIIKPTDKLTVNAALRFEDYTYNLPNDDTLGNQLLTTNYNNTHCINSANTISTRALNAACTAAMGAPTTLTANGTTKEDYSHIFSPRAGFTYALDPNTVVRGSFGRFTQGATTAAVDAPSLQSAAPSAPFYSNFGFNSYARFVEPETSYNYDASLEKSLPKADVSFKLTPFYRTTQNEFITILVDPKTNFVANINGLSRKAGGVEFAMTRGNFNRDGFAAQLSYTYTNAVAKYKVFPNGGGFVASANTAIQNFNAYTSTCGANPKLAQCGGGAQTTVASPCYTVVTATGGGTPDPTCAAGSVANPYYNSKLVGLLDPGASYTPYNTALGTAPGSGSSSYVVPHVAALILNYKKGPLRITPSFQFQGGTRYGTPFAAQGVAPDSCGATLASSVAGDPRYTNGAPGGSPYNAQSCAGLITIPNPQTGVFDGIGAYTQPNLIATNLSLNYDFNKNVGFNVIAANIFNRCFGGTHTAYSTGNIACAYTANPQFVGNLYNPGDSIQSFVHDSYTPVLGETALQSVAATSPVPFSLYFNLNLHL